MGAFTSSETPAQKSYKHTIERKVWRIRDEIRHASNSIKTNCHITIPYDMKHDIIKIFENEGYSVKPVYDNINNAEVQENNFVISWGPTVDEMMKNVK